MTTSDEELNRVRGALAPFVDGLNADGYDLDVESISGRVLAVKIKASGEACAECLVPKDVMAAILKDVVSGTLAVDSVQVTYPAEMAH